MRSWKRACTSALLSWPPRIASCWRRSKSASALKSILRQMQRLEAVGQLTSGVAHDFNNLLTVVLGNIGFLEKGLTAAGINGPLHQRLGYMRTAAERGAKLTDQLLSFSRRQRLEPKALDLNEAVTGMRDLLQSTMGGSIRIVTRLAPGLRPALVDPTQLELAALNLAINARDAMQIGGMLTVATANVTLGPPLSAEEACCWRLSRGERQPPKPKLPLRNIPLR